MGAETGDAACPSGSGPAAPRPGGDQTSPREGRGDSVGGDAVRSVDGISDVRERGANGRGDGAPLSHPELEDPAEYADASVGTMRHPAPAVAVPAPPPWLCSPPVSSPRSRKNASRRVCGVCGAGSRNACALCSKGPGARPVGAAAGSSKGLSRTTAGAPIRPTATRRRGPLGDSSLPAAPAGPAAASAPPSSWAAGASLDGYGYSCDRFAAGL